MTVIITELIDKKNCAYCGNKIRFWRKRGIQDRRFHFSCESILANNRKDPTKYANERFKQRNGVILIDVPGDKISEEKLI